jgi:16S rRNA (cytosine1402-N4)-methyltransferase
MHQPVLLREVIEYINCERPGFSMIDGTVGAGGYVREVVRINPAARILGVDLDRSGLDKLEMEFAKTGLVKNITLKHGNYRDLDLIAARNSFNEADAVLLDLGFSSDQLDQPNRGFSFQSRGRMDMRYDQSRGQTAADILNNYTERELERIFKEYGEERYSKKIAKAAVDKRLGHGFSHTHEIFELIEKIIPQKGGLEAKDSVRRIFQALRIETNSELANLKEALPKALKLLKSGGRMLVISFHSLEDRIVKQFFAEESKDCVCPPDFPSCVCTKSSNLKTLTKKPITAIYQELTINPKSRPAKLRVAEKR